ncbi:MAG: amino acid synthesis family protein [Ectothiorhodospiraceae bacterium]|nr:amino acid synthesis family protein [Ectothiorhodospiraceae bacterium]
MEIRQIVVVDQEVRAHASRAVVPPTRRVAACAVLANPAAGRPASDDLEPFAAASAEIGAELTTRALAALGDATPIGYGKAALVGCDGDLEQGAAMIHVRIGLAMRRGVGRGLALIPGNAKVGAAGDAIDVVFGGIDDGWDYDAMDTMTVVVPGAPRADEILLVVAFLAGGRPNARVAGASRERVEALVRELRGG